MGGEELLRTTSSGAEPLGAGERAPLGLGEALRYPVRRPSAAGESSRWKPAICTPAASWNADTVGAVTVCGTVPVDSASCTGTRGARRSIH